MQTNITFQELKQVLLSDLKIVSKEKRIWHYVIGFFLKLFGWNKEYMTRFSTVIGRRVAVPTEEDKARILSPEGMHEKDVAMVCHEDRHRDQSSKNYVIWSMKYLLSAKFRALMELDAYMITMTVYYFLGKKHTAQAYVDYVPRLLTGYYRCKPKHVKGFSEKLIQHYKNLEVGIYRPQDQPIVELLSDR